MNVWFNRIYGYYKDGLWTLEQVKAAVKMGKINEEEFKLITGEEYVA